MVSFSRDHKGFFKSSRLDSYNKLGVVVVPIQTTPLEAFVIATKWYRKLALPWAFPSQWPLPYTAQTYLMTATLAQDDRTGKESGELMCSP